MTVDLRHPEAPTAPPTATGRRPDIQGLRAIAVLLVVAFHAELPLPGGFVGVDVFFVISGFVIAAMLMRQWATAGRISFGQFYLRRFLRLTPALALLVTFVAAASILLQNPFGAQQTTARTGVGAMALSANAVIAHASGDYFASNATTNPLLHTWSLSVEEQFYLVFPALFVIGWMASRRLRRRLLPPVLIVTLIGAASFVASIVFSFGSPTAGWLTEFFGGPESFSFYSPFTRAWEFAAGALLALILERLVPLGRSLAIVTGLLGAGLVVASALFISESMAFPGYIALLPVAGTVLVILAGSHHTSGVNALLATRPLVAIGDVSYSWYLWHWPLIVFAALLLPADRTVLIIVAIASILPAIASYRFLEQPVRQMRPRSRPRAAAVVIATLTVPVIVCATLLVGANAGWGLTSTQKATGGSTATGAEQELSVADGEVAGGEGGTLRSQHIAVKAGCVNTNLSPQKCTFGPTDAIGTVLLAGDSQAYAVADGVVAAAEQLGYDTVVTSHTGCPFLARESSGVHNYPCRSWQKSIVSYALKTRPKAVVIANLSEGYVHPEAGWRTAATDSGRRAGSIDEAAALWRKGLEPIVSTLRKAGIGVVILTSAPQMVGYTDGTSLLSQAIGSRDFSTSRAESESSRKPAIDAERAVAKAHPGTFVHDPNPSLCDNTHCWASRDGTAYYQDETHVSVAGSLLLVGRLKSVLSQAIASSSTRPSPA